MCWIWACPPYPSPIGKPTNQHHVPDSHNQEASNTLSWYIVLVLGYVLGLSMPASLRSPPQEDVQVVWVCGCTIWFVCWRALWPMWCKKGGFIYLVCYGGCGHVALALCNGVGGGNWYKQGKWQVHSLTPKNTYNLVWPHWSHDWYLTWVQWSLQVAFLRSTSIQCNRWVIVKSITTRCTPSNTLHIVFSVMWYFMWRRQCVCLTNCIWCSTANLKCHVMFFMKQNECQLTSTSSSRMSPRCHMHNSRRHFNF